MVYEQLLVRLAQLEEEAGDHTRALGHLAALSERLPDRQPLQIWMRTLREAPPGVLDLERLGEWLAR
jgi:hypothetical protein